MTKPVRINGAYVIRSAESRPKAIIPSLVRPIPVVPTEADRRLGQAVLEAKRSLASGRSTKL